MLPFMAKVVEKKYLNNFYINFLGPTLAFGITVHRL